MSEPTLIELLEAEAKHRLTGDSADHGRYKALRAAAARLREEMVQASNQKAAYRIDADYIGEAIQGMRLATAERINGGPLAASPPPATGTGMKPGQRCTWIEHYESTPHRHSARDEREWNGREFSAAGLRRCPYVEPTPPPATCGTCGGTRKETFVFSHGQTIDEPCPVCAPPVTEKRCETCGDPLPPREPYNYVPFMLDGQVMTKRCPTCNPAPPTPAKEGP